MRKLVISLAILLGLLGCKRVDVSLPIPIRISGTVTVEGSDSLFVTMIAIPADTLGTEVSQQAEEAGIIAVDLESVVLVVSRKGTDCAADSIRGNVKLSLGIQPDTLKLASVTGDNLTEGDTLNVTLDSEGVDALNRFAYNSLEEADEILVVMVEGTAAPTPIDFDLEIVFTFTLVVVREMLSIGL